MLSDGHSGMPNILHNKTNTDTSPRSQTLQNNNKAATYNRVIWKFQDLE